MKILISTATLFLFFFLTGCDNTTESTVGSNNDTEIKNVSFTVDTTYLDAGNKRLVARGTATNLGTKTIASPWFIEAQFYTNATYSLKLGGSNTQIGVPLAPGEGTLWTIYYSSPNSDVRQYPDFKISNIRAIYKN